MVQSSPVVKFVLSDVFLAFTQGPSVPVFPVTTNPSDNPGLPRCFDVLVIKNRVITNHIIILQIGRRLGPWSIFNNQKEVCSNPPWVGVITDTFSFGAIYQTLAASCHTLHFSQARHRIPHIDRRPAVIIGNEICHIPPWCTRDKVLANDRAGISIRW